MRWMVFAAASWRRVRDDARGPHPPALQGHGAGREAVCIPCTRACSPCNSTRIQRARSTSISCPHHILEATQRSPWSARQPCCASTHNPAQQRPRRHAMRALRLLKKPSSEGVEARSQTLAARVSSSVSARTGWLGQCGRGECRPPPATHMGPQQDQPSRCMGAHCRPVLPQAGPPAPRRASPPADPSANTSCCSHARSCHPFRHPPADGPGPLTCDSPNTATEAKPHTITPLSASTTSDGRPLRRTAAATACVPTYGSPGRSTT